jgi:protein phosphatase 2C family protein 2/3
MYHNWFEK